MQRKVELEHSAHIRYKGSDHHDSAEFAVLLLDRSDKWDELLQL